MKLSQFDHDRVQAIHSSYIALMSAVVAAGPAVASEETEVMVLFVPIRFPSSMNFHPYAWHGAGACAKWSSDYDADAKKKGYHRRARYPCKPSQIDVFGDCAYVVSPANYAYKEKVSQ